jgi:hypothetical protein
MPQHHEGMAGSSSKITQNSHCSIEVNKHVFVNNSNDSACAVNNSHVIELVGK